MITSHDMSDLEQLAGRIVMIDRGLIAFDGDFTQLRRQLGASRRLLIETDARSAPALDGAHHVRSEGCRHEYVFDDSKANIPDLLAQAARRAAVLDVETHQTPIDDVIADLYETWKSALNGQNGGNASRPETQEIATN